MNLTVANETSSPVVPVFFCRVTGVKLYYGALIQAAPVVALNYILISYFYWLLLLFCCFLSSIIPSLDIYTISSKIKKMIYWFLAFFAVFGLYFNILIFHLFFKIDFSSRNQWTYLKYILNKSKRIFLSNDDFSLFNAHLMWILMGFESIF